MEITINRIDEKLPIVVFIPHGPLDASNYGELIEAAQREYKSGVRRMIIDLSDTPYMASAGIVAIHTIAKLTSGIQPSQAESGWEATKASAQAPDADHFDNLILLNPSTNVERLLAMVGYTKYLRVYLDLESAVASFPS